MAEEANGQGADEFDPSERERLRKVVARLESGSRISAPDRTLVARLIKASLGPGVEPDRTPVSCFVCEGSGSMGAAGMGLTEETCPQCKGSGEIPSFWPRLVRNWRCDESFERPVKRPVIEREAMYVRVRPYGREHGGREYVGLLLGDLPLGAAVGIDDAGGMTIKPAMFNAAIYVFHLKSVVYGGESTWVAVSRPEDLDRIQDHDRETPWVEHALATLRADAA